MTGIPYDVYLKEEHVGVVWYPEHVKLEEVWSSLVNSRGYSEDIVVMSAL